jgi:HSP90 family molecular chaperone
MVGPIDEYVLRQLKELDGTKLKSVTRKGLDLGDVNEHLKEFDGKKWKSVPKTGIRLGRGRQAV